MGPKYENCLVFQLDGFDQFTSFVGVQGYFGQDSPVFNAHEVETRVDPLVQLRLIHDISPDLLKYPAQLVLPLAVNLQNTPKQLI
jgi:hypothetical protein